MTLAKYNEIMEHIDVSKESHDRILSNVNKRFSSKKQPDMRTWITIAGAAAAALLLLFAIGPWLIQLNRESKEQQHPSDVLAVHNETEYASCQELSEAVGFDIQDLTPLPFEPESSEYLKIADFAEINYTSNQETLSYRKSIGTEDNSGDYETYVIEKDISVSGVAVTLKGDDKSIYLAIWTDGTYSYSLRATSGLSEEKVLSMIKNTLSS